MKKLLLLLIFFLLSCQAFSQSNSSISPFEIGLTSTVGNFGLNNTFHSETFPLCFEGCAITGNNPSGSFSIGISGRYNFNTTLSLISGFTYASNSYNEEFTGSTGASNFTTDTRRQFDFLEVPVLVHANVNALPGNRISFFAETGIINNLNLNRQFPNSDSNIELNRYGISGSVSAGVRLSAKRINIEVAPFYTRSFTSYGKDVRPSEITQNYTPEDFRPHSMGIKLNLLMPLKF